MCEALLKSAFETEPGNVEALICMSSLRLSQQKPEEALECATRAWLAWKDIEDGVPILLHDACSLLIFSI